MTRVHACFCALSVVAPLLSMQGQKALRLGMGDMGLKIYQHISDIYCDNDINDDNSGNPVSLEKSIIFPIFTPNRVLGALLSTHFLIHTESRRAPLCRNTTYP